MGSQGGGRDEGEFNSTEEKASVVNFARKLVGIFFHWSYKNATPAALGAQKDEAKESQASTSRGDTASKQLRGGGARARLCPLCGRTAVYESWSAVYLGVYPR